MAHTGLAAKSCTLCLWEGASLWHMEDNTILNSHVEERQRVLGVTRPLQGVAVSPILKWTKYKTARGVEASPMGTEAVTEGDHCQSSKLQKTAPSGAKAHVFSAFSQPEDRVFKMETGKLRRVM